MYAVVEIGGHQYKVTKDQTLFVDKQNAADQKLEITRVLLVSGENGVQVGTPTVAGAKVEATVLDTVKADKLIVFKKKRRKGYQKKTGHRQKLSQIRIDNIIA
jgi:large subunit ribosomal protein L21